MSLDISKHPNSSEGVFLIYMQKNKKINIIVSLGFLLVGLFFLLPVFSPEETKTIPEERAVKSVVSKSADLKTVKTTLEVNDEAYEGEIKTATSVYDFMKSLEIEGKINFSERNYIGMGKIITAINGVKSNGEYTWIYYVNGKEADIGVSNYKINSGDVVSWKYEKVHY